ncbi:DUF7059 domain-containing protein [Galbitalea soli]|uniref:Methyltransferase n=1 Tax=Galbitalea soli TaxID=1268042 RepID=A0A7C9PNF7_9MICO|nr:methyltransferase [Galbitalea soli]NEM91634.1 methyltransferase [Galbitalea soli]NYJ30330.1 methylase of polypeptide subunit release factors [Galbitalea soli]
MTADALPALLARDLGDAGYTVAGLRALWGEEADAALHRGHRVPARRALDALPAGADDRAATLARTFVLGLPADAARLERALPAAGVAGVQQLGLVRADGGTVIPTADLRPYSFTDAWGAAEWWIASDLGEVAVGGPLGEDHVLGVGGASLTLAGLMVDRSSRLTLDLGTGCGIQALHASRHSGRVIATDISERALRFARLNAALNGVSTIEFRHGSLFEPVAGETFDHIVSNPPFVITPRAEGVPAYEYRDGGLVGDAIVAAVIEGMSTHLAPGGVGQLLGNWEYRAGAGGLARVEGWLEARAAEGHPLDAWVVEREVQPVELYTETWIRDGGTRPGPDFDRLAEAWLDDFAARGVSAVGFGYVTVRRPLPGAGVLRRFEHVESGGGALGPHIAATLAAHDWQAARDDAEFARAALTVAADVTEERHYWPGDEHPAVMNLHQGGGFARSYPLDTALAAVVGASDGELSVAAICAAIAELLGSPDAPLSPDALLAELVPTLRELVTVGILLPPA